MLLTDLSLNVCGCINCKRIIYISIYTSVLFISNTHNLTIVSNVHDLTDHVNIVFIDTYYLFDQRRSLIRHYILYDIFLITRR